VSARFALLFSLSVLLGLVGCRSPRSTATTRAARPPTTACKTGPLNRTQAVEEALAAVVAQTDQASTCSVAGVRENSETYEVCVRIDNPQRRLPKHWTVEVPKSGITRGAGSGGG